MKKNETHSFSKITNYKSISQNEKKQKNENVNSHHAKYRYYKGMFAKSKNCDNNKTFSIDISQIKKELVKEQYDYQNANTTKHTKQNYTNIRPIKPQIENNSHKLNRSMSYTKKYGSKSKICDVIKKPVRSTSEIKNKILQKDEKENFEKDYIQDIKKNKFCLEKVFHGTNRKFSELSEIKNIFYKRKNEYVNYTPQNIRVKKIIKDKPIKIFDKNRKEENKEKKKYIFNKEYDDNSLQSSSKKSKISEQIIKKKNKKINEILCKRLM